MTTTYSNTLTLWEAPITPLVRRYTSSAGDPPPSAAMIYFWALHIILVISILASHLKYLQYNGQYSIIYYNTLLVLSITPPSAPSCSCTFFKCATFTFVLYCIRQLLPSCRSQQQTRWHGVHTLLTLMLSKYFSVMSDLCVETGPVHLMFIRRIPFL